MWSSLITLSSATEMCACACVCVWLQIVFLSFQLLQMKHNKRVVANNSDFYANIIFYKSATDEGSNVNLNINEHVQTCGLKSGESELHYKKQFRCERTLTDFVCVAFANAYWMLVQVRHAVKRFLSSSQTCHFHIFHRHTILLLIKISKGCIYYFSLFVIHFSIHLNSRGRKFIIYWSPSVSKLRAVILSE